MTVKLPKVGNNLFDEMNPEWNCIVSKKTCFQQVFSWKQKRRVKKLFCCNRIWKTQEKIKF